MVRCQMSATFWTVMDELVSAEVHRIVIVDEKDILKGMITLSDVIKFVVLRHPKVDRSDRSETMDFERSIESDNHQRNISPIKEEPMSETWTNTRL